ncbi:GDSL-like Lipase/Acylhydrolase [Limihaloglobus sulfuriphilus]|uniref:GDSL-like Lipase/Acylhydrolase n=1 Tax=Limihaloglobus sulfuriphilus TaxID=1851148 RepID=A0A1Q2MEQ3_9BACT|nr:GDSL-type esterase/lipase family protein [Limihaloglobus sulfuriphilus]AQQ71134.1 GDSL-like Lipase/Acylhydrolase [Limihaloglobus sulfuriphilus]
MKKTKFTLIIFQLALTISVPQAAKAEAAAKMFDGGDVVCFIGDSITHSGTWHVHVQNYYLTRFPERHIEMYNCGIGGHTAEKTLVNFGWDVTPRRPSQAVIMLGMNDLRKAGTDSEVWQDYISRMKELSNLIKTETDAHITWISPSPYDDMLELELKPLQGFSDLLNRTSQELKAFAAENNGSYIDFNQPMNRINLKRKQTDPEFTLIGGDRIHPGALGNMVMAYLFLTAQEAPATVSRAGISAAEGILFEGNCKINIKTRSFDRIAFTIKAKALPFPMPEETFAALGIVPIEKELNQEILQVTELDTGSYTVTIDNKIVGRFTNSELEQGINLAYNKNTPQYIQSQEIARLSEEKRKIEFKLRTESMLKVLLSLHGIEFDGNDRTNVYAMFDREEVKELFAPGGKFSSGGALRYWKRYQAEKQSLHTAQREIKEIISAIYKINMPREHRYEIKK